MQIYKENHIFRVEVVIKERIALRIESSYNLWQQVLLPSINVCDFANQEVTEVQ